MKEIDPAYERMMITINKYSEVDKIPIRRLKRVLSQVHRFSRPYSTRIIKRMSDMDLIKLNGKRDITILWKES